MNVFRYFGPVFLLNVLQLLVKFPCQAETHLEGSHVKSSAKNQISRTNNNKNILEKDLNRRKTLQAKSKEKGTPSKQKSASSVYLENERQSYSKKHKINDKDDIGYHMVGKADDKLKKPSAGTHSSHRSRELKNKSLANGTNGRQLTHSKKSKLTNNGNPVKLEDIHQKDDAKKKKKKIFKKYALVQSFSPLQSQSEDYQPIPPGGEEPLTAGYAPLTEGDQTGDLRQQDSSQQQQQQQQIGDENALSQYDSTGYQQDSSQSSVANLASSNGEDASQSEGGQQPSSLEQAIQLQQEAYTQQPQEQGQESDSQRPGTQGADLGGQESQLIDGGQLQYQSEQGSQGQEQGAQEGAQEQGADQTGFEQGGYQQEQTQDLGQQQPEGLDQQLQQQQDQAQGYQPQPQQQAEESQGSEGAPSETQSFTTSSSSLGSLFGTEGQQTTAEQQGQGTVSYANEQPSGGGDKGAPPGVQYASSIEEALKEPAVPSEVTNSEGGDSQGSLGTSDSASVINVGGNSDSREGNSNGFTGVGTISAPSGYQMAAIDDNNNQASAGTEVNGYAAMNDQASNTETTGLEENHQQQSPVDSQNAFNFPGQHFQQPGPGGKLPPLDDDFYKIIDIANKNGPMAVKGCKGCPPHARCIDKVCIINDDQPLAHILNALSGPEPDDEPPPSECKDCHYNAKCTNRECVCKAGYTGDGFDCRPDTCLPGCKQHGKCIKGFCVCDHHHYFNGYECAPYKITHRNCPLQCTTRCHAGCLPNCCKHHPVLKIHYNDGNLQQINVPPNALPQKNATTPRPTVVVLKPESKMNEHVANFAPDFQQRPDDSEATNLEAVNLKNPTGGFAVSEMAARPLLEDGAECPDRCKSECHDSCPVRCCLGKCPLSCMENCLPSCPKTCCYLPRDKHLFPMMDSKVQENFMKTMAEKFCPRACKIKCNPNCPPICCERNASHSATLESTGLQQLKGESKSSADFFQNAMSWFGMMNFLNMMYSMYGNLYGNKHFAKFPVKTDDHKLKTATPTKPKTARKENRINFKGVGVAESHSTANDLCPDHCNTTCLHDCPMKCCRVKPEEKSSNKVGIPLKCQPACASYCSKGCPPLCCSKSSDPLIAEHHPTAQIKIVKSSPVSPTPKTAPPDSSFAKPPAACTPSCPAYCYPKCLVNCCQRGEINSKKLSEQPVAPDKTKQSYSNFFAKEPSPTNQDCPPVCRHDCGPSCPLRCCYRGLTSPTPSRLASGRPSIDTPLCPGGCASECFPACTISCCRAGFKKEDSNVQPVSPTRREHQPTQNLAPFPLPPPAAVCQSGCSRSCYPNCDESCCRAYLEHASGLSSPNKLGDPSHFTIKVPCPSECRPFNCLYYCHHDCCLPRSEGTALKKRRYQDTKKYLRDMRKVTTTTKVLGKSTGGRIGKRRTVIHKRPLD